MRLVPAGRLAELDRYIGYFQPYATSHDALDEDLDIQVEVRNAAIALQAAVTAQREVKLIKQPDLTEPRPK